MNRKSAIYFGFLFILIAAVAIAAISTRYQVIEKRDGYIRFDRWTGVSVACRLQECVEYGKAQRSSLSYKEIAEAMAETNGFRIAEARQSGYSDEEIIRYLMKKKARCK